MKEQKKLIYGMSLLFLTIFVFFGVIIVNVKTPSLKIPKVKEKLETYLNENYKEETENLSLEDIEYKNLKYIGKVTYKNNKNHYFNIYYENKKITDTYKKDYLEGTNILNYHKNFLEKEISKKTNIKVKVTMSNKLNKYTKEIQDIIINSKNIKKLKIYDLEQSIYVEDLQVLNITKAIKNNISYYKKLDINPKSYTFIITNKNDITKALNIKNITNEIVENNNLDTIIDVIINKKNKEILDIYNITYEYLN